MVRILAEKLAKQIQEEKAFQECQLFRKQPNTEIQLIETVVLESIPTETPVDLESSLPTIITSTNVTTDESSSSSNPFITSSQLPPVEEVKEIYNWKEKVEVVIKKCDEALQEPSISYLKKHVTFTEIITNTTDIRQVERDIYILLLDRLLTSTDDEDEIGNIQSVWQQVEKEFSTIKSDSIK